MKILIKNGRVIDPASGRDEVADVAIAGRPHRRHRAGQLADFTPNAPSTPAAASWPRPGGPGRAPARARPRARGHAGERAGRRRGRRRHQPGLPARHRPGAGRARPGGDAQVPRRKLQPVPVFPLGALTRGLQGRGADRDGRADRGRLRRLSPGRGALVNTQVLQRALQYAATFGYTVWLRPQDAWLGKGVAASGALATRLGLSGVPVAAETIALHTIFELVRATGARVHLCRISSAAGVPGAPGQGRGPAGHCRRQHQLAAPDRHRHRLLRQPMRLTRRCASSATATRCARPGRRHHRRAGVRPHPGGRRRQDPALCRGRARRHRPGAAAELALKWGQESLAASPANRPGAGVLGLQASWATGGRRRGRVCIFDPQTAWIVACAARASTRRSRGRTAGQGALHPGGRADFEGWDP
jgi:hypothetical protein